MNDELDHIFGDDPDLVDEDAPADDAALDPAGSIPGGTAELAALAAHDANDLLRFVESAMTEAESETFLDEVRGRDPESADRLLRMREDQRLLRTSLDLEPPPADVLGPVRARLARGELVQVQSEIGAEEADPTAFMSRSVATLARRRRRARRRPFALAGILGVSGLAIWVIVSPPFGGGDADVRPAATASPRGAEPASLATFGLVLPFRDRDRIELAMSVVAANHGAVLVRHPVVEPDGRLVEPSASLVGRKADGPSIDLQERLAARGFGYAIVATRDEVSTVLAEVGALAHAGPQGRTSARLVPSSSTDPGAALSDDLWQSWSHQSEAADGLPDDVRRLVVPIALVESIE